MSSINANFLLFVSHKITIYVGLFGLLSGLLGNLLNIIVFTSLKTFRETSCALYLTAAATFNIIHLLASLFSRILITGYGLDLTRTSSILCKLRQYVAIAGLLIALSCMCFATIDQFLLLTNRWRYLSQRRIARRLIIFTIMFWCLYSLLGVIFYDSVYSPTVDQWSCSITNSIFSIYYSRFHISILIGFFQLSIRICFSLLAFINVRSLSNRRIPIIRLGRDKQLTTMVLIQTIVDVILSLPFVIYYTYTSYMTITDPITYASMVSITNIFYYLTFAVGFYIYYCSSSRFRKQLIYVLFEVHLKYCCYNPNRIMPQTNETQDQPAVIQSITLNV